MSEQPIVELRNISKSYGSVQALRDVTVTLSPGTVHAFAGENGAGKSTLGRVIAGAVSPDRGSILIDGNVARLKTPHEALAHGVTVVAQELALLPARTVLDNVFLGQDVGRFGIVNKRALLERYARLQDLVGLDVDPKRKVRTLRIADQQKVEILRAVARNARVIVLDEPTSSLPLDDARTLMQLIRRLADRGTTIVLVSHNLSEVMAVSDTITVLKDGQLVHTRPAAQHDENSLIGSMLGRALDKTFPPKAMIVAGRAPVLQVSELEGSNGLCRTSFRVAPGEIVGIAGLVGSGRSELLRTIFGVDRRLHGSVHVDGAKVPAGPRQSLKFGLALLPENRRDEGLVLGRPVDENVVLSRLSDYCYSGVVHRGHVRASAKSCVADYGVRVRSVKTPVGQLSGGNQQKVLLARCLLGSPQVLLADEPTRGVDVGAKLAIYQLLTEAATRGVGIVLASSDMDEIIGLSHRVLVMKDKRVVQELSGPDINEGAIMHAAFGGQRSTSATHAVSEVTP